MGERRRAGRALPAVVSPVVLGWLRGLAEELASASTVEQVAAAAVRAGMEAVRGDTARVVLADEDGGYLQAGAAAVDSALSAGSGHGGNGLPSGLSEVLSERRTQVINPNVGDTSEGLRDELRATEPIRPAVGVPLVVGGVLAGALVVELHRRAAATDGDVALVELIALQCAETLGRVAGPYPATQVSRGAGPEEERTRLLFLAEVGRALGDERSLAGTLSRLGSLAAPRIADWCLVYIAETGPDAAPVTVSHQDPDRASDMRAMLERWPARLDAAGGAGAALRTGQRQLRRTLTEEDLAGCARTDSHLEALRAMGMGDVADLPIRLGSEVLGVVELVTRRGRRLTDADIGLAAELADRAAVPIRNASEFEEDRRVIERLGAGVLPAKLPRIPGVELAAHYVAATDASGIGGDFYDAFALDGGRWLVAIGDVRGKGVQAAAVTGLARATIRTAAMEGHRPSRVLAMLNRMLLDTEPDYPDEPVSVPRFCTVLLVELAPTPDALFATVCAGGHPLPYLLSPDGTVREVGTPGTMLGALDMPELHDHPLQLPAGSALLATTDGILERRDEREEFFEDRLPQTLRAAAGAGAGTLIASLFDSVERFTDEPPSDDMAAIAIWSAPGRPVASS